MQTPIRQKKSRRVMTTAHTEPRMLTNSCDQWKQYNRSPMFMGELSNDINKRLKFQGEDQPKLYQTKTRQLGKILQASQQSYRKSVLNYLNCKFQYFYPAKQTKSSKINRSINKDASYVMKQEQQHIKTLFKSYIDVIRQQRIRRVSQYTLGVLLKQTHFINNILYQRDTIALLWRQLKQPNMGELFVFICVLYFHLEKSRLKSQNDLLIMIQGLFSELGFKFSACNLETTLQRSKVILQGHPLKFKLLNNRQSRHTATSKNRHKQHF